MEKLSVCILTFNDAHTIEWAISSVQWADEVVVLDTGSTDNTVEIAAALGARVMRIPFTDFGELRNRAAQAGSFDWVMSLDSDEHCTPALRDEIRALLAAGPAHDAYRIPRRNFIMGRWMRGSGWYPDYRQVQLFRKACMRYTASPIHEGYELSSDRPVGQLKNEILHYPYRDLEEILSKANLYSTLGARKLANRRVSMWSALAHGMWAFLRIFLLKGGFKNGWAGFVIALGNFEGTFYRYAKRHEQMNSWGLPRDEADPARRS